ncbi:ABC transporter ATP-binding protein [Mycoplasma phocoenae]|uniref:ABC transporter ATP-binding protein n=1 Tax=Mycoplasma phocoenae TaxID=754517 RepID=A0A858U427_9MOLU|nr:ABC transporter ATP-binding protein [Mycoplasma phocoenae]QJG66771.1 ABC transporter ATP-binding protein [Mycoplasma phocoenae]
MKNIYCEKHWNKQVCRKPVDGLDEMLNAYPNKNNLVEMRHVDIEYGFGAKKFTAIKDLSLNIYEGEILGLVGESGSGKSTTGRALIGLTPHAFGSIKIIDRIIPKNINKGITFTKKHKEMINFMVNKVQMIFQDPTNSLNPYANVERVVGEGLQNTKNAKHIYMLEHDRVTITELHKQIKSINARLKKIDQLIHLYNKEYNNAIDSSYNFIYSNIYEHVIELNKKYKNFNSALTYLDERKSDWALANKKSEKEARYELIIDILKQVGLDESVLNRYPLEFSGGQQQRLGISRSVVIQPKLLIADEPISALDVSIQAQVINIFKELKERFDLTMLLIAHDLRMVEYISDRIAVINKGVLLEIGPTHEVSKNSYHPYTKSLLEAVPSITGEKGSLLGTEYDPSIHNYSADNQPKWQNLGNGHFVLLTDDELKEIKKQKKSKK